MIKELEIQQMEQQFKLTVAICISMMVAVASFLYVYGKQDSFILINGYYNEPLDYFFQYVTLLGDGLIYIPIVIYCAVYNRKYLVPIIAGIIICTILTHFFKRIVFPEQLRPISLEAENIIIRKIEGVPIHRNHSFPSGHTSTAFSMALLLAVTMKRRIWCLVLPLIAFLVGYSRVYLSQHFVTDVFAGMTIGIISAYLSLLIYKAYLKKQAAKVSIVNPEKG